MEKIEKVSRAPKPLTHFLISLTGRVESAEMHGVNNLYVKYNFSAGSDWQIIAGMQEGISQITGKDREGKMVWNFPVEVTFKSTNPHGWPQLVLSVYGTDIWGNHVVRGYGVIHIPLCQGSATKIVPLFVPESSTVLQKISCWLFGRRPEFIDPKIVAQNEGRQIIRVNSLGHVTVQFEVIIKDFAKLGFVTSAKRYGGHLINLES